ncbi:unnamed protein product [Pieris macdunnoughi]|uniref:Uncharacterized protein n=1 Tax=Pieris macdunnoughi TaxID=345717 RepID=A0A821TG19_9NEOP|nr:unnamed protein product [Pieris macdunnoughi]
MGKEMNDLLKQCIDLPQIKVNDDVDQIIQKSQTFPIPFPVNKTRLEPLRERKPIEREFGSSIEKTLYCNMTVPEFIDRLLKKRAVTFMTKKDTYKLLTGETGNGGWEQVGTLQQKPPLELETCYSYDEIKLSAMVYVSGYTECINDGNRYNQGIINEKNVEEDALIIGHIGPRFDRPERME